MGPHVSSVGASAISGLFTWELVSNASPNKTNLLRWVAKQNQLAVAIESKWPIWFPTTSQLPAPRTCPWAPPSCRRNVIDDLSLHGPPSPSAGLGRPRGPGFRRLLLKPPKFRRGCAPLKHGSALLVKILSAIKVVPPRHHDETACVS